MVGNEYQLMDQLLQALTVNAAERSEASARRADNTVRTEYQLMDQLLQALTVNAPERSEGASRRAVSTG
jgi:hypothetical protein